MTGDWRLYVRDKDRLLVAEADEFFHLELVLRFNLPGSWLVELPADSTAAAALAVWGSGLVAVRDGITVLTGPTRRLERTWSSSENVLAAAGVDDLGYLSDRIAVPKPDFSPPQQAYDVRTGPAETVMHGYVNVNAGPGAIPARRVPGLVAGIDTALGTTVTGRARYHHLIELLRDLALAGGDLGYRVLQAGSDLRFAAYAPVDRTGTAVFSPEFGNLRRFSYEQESPEGNYVYVGGGGEGTQREIVEGGDQPSIIKYGRVEKFRDRRDTTDDNELNQALAEELAEYADRATLRIAPVDTDALRYLRDYTLGDRVTVVVDGVAIQDTVREVHLELSQRGSEEITPMIGTPGTQEALSGLFGDVLKLRSRISNLENR